MPSVFTVGKFIPMTNAVKNGKVQHLPQMVP
jgi:hypothetical protein